MKRIEYFCRNIRHNDSIEDQMREAQESGIIKAYTLTTLSAMNARRNADICLWCDEIWSHDHIHSCLYVRDHNCMFTCGEDFEIFAFVDVAKEGLKRVVRNNSQGEALIHCAEKVFEEMGDTNLCILSQEAIISSAHQVFDGMSNPNSSCSFGFSVGIDLASTQTTINVDHSACHDHPEINNIEYIVTTSSDLSSEIEDGTEISEAHKVLDEMPLPDFIREMAQATKIDDLQAGVDYVIEQLTDCVPVKDLTSLNTSNLTSDQILSPHQTKVDMFDNYNPLVQQSDAIHDHEFELDKIHEIPNMFLGKDCYDFDIAIDNMLGRELCQKINEYLFKEGEGVKGIGIIQCNPNQSKQLGTARMRLSHQWIDFVNLRAEDYCENRRIPTMKFDTLEEDAYRRDLTINNLFYNIYNDSVEDLTGSGITVFIYSQLSMTSVPNLIFDPGGERIGMVPGNCDDTFTCGRHVRMEAQIEVFDPGLILMDIVSLWLTHVGNKCVVMANDLGGISLDVGHNLKGERLISEECTQEPVDFFCFDPGGLWACDLWDDDDGLLHELSLPSDISNFRFGVFVLAFLARNVLSDMGIEVLICIPILEDKGDLMRKEMRLMRGMIGLWYSPAKIKDEFNGEEIYSGNQAPSLDILKSLQVKLLLRFAPYNGFVAIVVWIYDPGRNDMLVALKPVVFDLANKDDSNVAIHLFAYVKTSSQPNASKRAQVCSIVNKSRTSMMAPWVSNPRGIYGVSNMSLSWEIDFHHFKNLRVVITWSSKMIVIYVFDPGGSLMIHDIGAIAGRFVRLCFKYHLLPILEDKDRFMGWVMIHTKSIKSWVV